MGRRSMKRFEAIARRVAAVLAAPLPGRGPPRPRRQRTSRAERTLRYTSGRREPGSDLVSDTGRFMVSDSKTRRHRRRRVTPHGRATRELCRRRGHGARRRRAGGPTRVHRTRPSPTPATITGGGGNESCAAAPATTGSRGARSATAWTEPRTRRELGGDGNDTFSAGPLARRRRRPPGRRGVDQVGYGKRKASIAVSLEASRTTVKPARATTSARTSRGGRRERGSTGSSGARPRTASRAAPGNDFIDGRAGADALNGGRGADGSAVAVPSVDRVDCGAEGPACVPISAIGSHGTASSWA